MPSAWVSGLSETLGEIQENQVPGLASQFLVLLSDSTQVSFSCFPASWQGWHLKRFQQVLETLAESLG